MRNQVIWGIRDARELTVYEAMLIFVVESRGTCEATRERMQADMKCGKDSFYAARKSLHAKGILGFKRKYDDVTAYWIDADVFLAYAKDSARQDAGVGDSVSQTGDSVPQNEDSVRPETKKNSKKNRKKNVTRKKNTTAPVVADAPTVSVSSSQGEPTESLPHWGAVLTSETGDVLFEVATGSGRYVLCESGITGPLPETRTAAPVDLDSIPIDAATSSPLDRELAECRRRWASTGETGWKATEARMAEETAIRERHGEPVGDW